MASLSLDATAVGEESSPEEIVEWTLRRFANREVVVTTSFGMEGCALIDMVARQGVALRVIYLDTMFLFPETYALRDRMAARYPHLRFENRGTTLTPEAQAERYGPDLWRRDPDRFGTRIDTGRNQYMWLGTTRLFDAFTFAFVRTEAGWIWCH